MVIEGGRDGGWEREKAEVSSSWGLTGMGAALCKLSIKITPQYRRKSSGRSWYCNGVTDMSWLISASLYVAVCCAECNDCECAREGWCTGHHVSQHALRMPFTTPSPCLPVLNQAGLESTFWSMHSFCHFYALMPACGNKRQEGNSLTLFFRAGD